MEQLRNAIEIAADADEYAFTVLMIDVDRFRWLADSVGHHAADEMLRVVSRRLVACVRPGDTVARFGGDKFAVLLDNVEDLELGTHIADRIRRSVSEPIEVTGQTIYATVSIGLTTSTRGYDDAEDVVNDAAAAANKAKEAGHDRYAVFETKMRIDALSTLRLEVALRQAVTTVAAAPSDVWDALPAVTIPPAAKAGLSLASPAALVSGRGPSSTSKVTVLGLPSPLGRLTVSGTTSSWKRPAAMAASAFWCEPRANASDFSRSMPYFRATASAVRPMPR
jgi:diguanylate cyclase (GGDEF)-like protein